MGGFYTVGVEDVHSFYEKEEIRREADRYIVSFGGTGLITQFLTDQQNFNASGAFRCAL